MKISTGGCLVGHSLENHRKVDLVREWPYSGSVSFNIFSPLSMPPRYIQTIVEPGVSRTGFRLRLPEGCSVQGQGWRLADFFTPQFKKSAERSTLTLGLTTSILVFAPTTIPKLPPSQCYGDLRLCRIGILQRQFKIYHTRDRFQTFQEERQSKIEQYRANTKRY